MAANSNIEHNEELKKTPFKVPEGYFETLDAKLQSIAAAEPKVLEMPAKSKRLKWMRIAATLLILISATWYFSRSTNQTQPELTSEEVLALAEDGYISFSETALLDVVTLEELEQMELTETDVLDYYETLQPELIEEYYIYEDI